VETKVEAEDDGHVTSMSLSIKSERNQDRMSVSECERERM